jgi:hypothetical protein
VWLNLLSFLRIKAFFGTSENAVKSQIWIAVSVYVLVAIVKKRLKLSATLYEILRPPCGAAEGPPPAHMCHFVGPIVAGISLGREEPWV